jgi:hypothetical protein
MKKRLKKIVFISVLGFIIILGIAYYYFAQTQEFIFLEVKFKSCPYGHYSLKAVPISYGFMLPDSNYFKRVDNYETYPGGCTFSKDSPKYKVICTKCGYVFEDNNSNSYWIKGNDSNEGFEVPLDTIISNLPLINIYSLNNLQSLNYAQKYRDGKIIEEAIRYQSISSASDLEEIILNYAELNKLNFHQVNSSNEEPSDFYKFYKNYQAQKNNRIYVLTISVDKEFESKNLTFFWELKNN